MSELYTVPLIAGYTYHIFNKGNNGEDIFKEARNYPYFIEKYKKYIAPICRTYAYCLLPNHFHFMVQFKSYKELYKAMPKRFPKPPEDLGREPKLFVELGREISKALSEQFRFFFGAYAKAINKAYSREGKLFTLPFRRILVDNESYFFHLLFYVHRNPIHHGFCQQFEEWDHSSFHQYRNGIMTGLVDIEFILQWFESLEEFLAQHKLIREAYLEQKYYLE